MGSKWEVDDNGAAKTEAWIGIKAQASAPPTDAGHGLLYASSSGDANYKKPDGTVIPLTSGSHVAKTYMDSLWTVVEPTGDGDYTTLSDAINAGKKKILVVGEISDDNLFYIPSDTVIRGLSPSVSKVNLGSNTLNLYQSGYSVVTTGTISITNGSTTVTGSGTSWTSDGVSSGDIIIINGVPYEIASVTSDTQLTITETYRGNSLSGIEYYIYMNHVHDITIENITIETNSQYSIYAIAGYSVDLDNVRVINTNTTLSNTYGVYYKYITRGHITGCTFNGAGINTAYVRSVVVYGNTVERVRYYGIYVYDSIGCDYVSNVVFGSGQDGIFISMKAKSTFFGNTISGAYRYGLMAGRDCQESILSGNIINNCGSHGIALLSAHDNIIDGNVIADNGGSGIYMAVWSGYSASPVRNVVTDNNIRNNGAFGIQLTSAASENAIHGNRFKGNSSGDYSISASNVLLADNMFNSGLGGLVPRSVNKSNINDGTVTPVRRFEIVANLYDNNKYFNQDGTTTGWVQQ